MKLACALALSLSVLGCNTGMKAVHDPHALVAPHDHAVLVVIGAGPTPVLLASSGSCLGYVHTDAWFTARLPAGEQIVHLKTPDAVLSAKIDVASGKTYFVRVRGTDDRMVIEPIAPTTPGWSSLDGLLQHEQQDAVDTKQCNDTLGSMTWMPGQNLEKLVADGTRAAEVQRPILQIENGVVWRGSARTSR